jgi:hypothetical protein
MEAGSLRIKGRLLDRAARRGVGAVLFVSVHATAR